MGNSSSSTSRWDALFQALTKPEDLKAYLQAYEVQAPPAGTAGEPGSSSSSGGGGSSSGGGGGGDGGDGERSASELRMQVHLLRTTLRVDPALLKVQDLAESFDTATFCLGQLVSHEPVIVSRLPFAMIFVEGLSAALLHGWKVHHGVGKFAANALTILAICEDANTKVREAAVDAMLEGMLEWLHDSTNEKDTDEVCGCNCGCAALSAASWVERLLGKPDELLTRQLLGWGRSFELHDALLAVVSERDGNPFALTRLLCVRARPREPPDPLLRRHPPPTHLHARAEPRTPSSPHPLLASTPLASLPPRRCQATSPS